MGRLTENIWYSHVPQGKGSEQHPEAQKNLRVWRHVYDPPPTALPFPTTFLPLQDLITNAVEACGWITWLARRGRTPDAPNIRFEYAGLQATLTHTPVHSGVRGHHSLPHSCPRSAFQISPFCE